MVLQEILGIILIVFFGSFMLFAIAYLNVSFYWFDGGLYIQDI